MKNILLIEPGYKNKYPPMGLMKISTYHKRQGDNVVFVKGIDKSLHDLTWDRIYITTLFTFDFDICVKTINYYKTFVDNSSNLFVGGIMASLMPGDLAKATGLSHGNIIKGLFTDSSTVGDNRSINIDEMPLDYDILDMITYKYPAGDNYFAYLTRGCPNHCPFCAVPILEPTFKITNNINKQIETINELYGPKKDLLLLDNNILNAPNLTDLVNDLCQSGFSKGAMFVDPGAYEITMKRYKRGEKSQYLDNKLMEYLHGLKKRIPKGEKRDLYIDLLLDAESSGNISKFMIDSESEIRPYVDKYKSKALKKRNLDFNQGVDARRINDDNMAQLSRLCIKPLRIAFDNISLERTYSLAVRTAFRHGIEEISNYILFNYKDYPQDLYKRLECNIRLNQELGIKIFSFPMRYSPVDRTDRMYVGENWTLKELRAISAILQVTKGVVAAGTSFFYKAFGKDINEYCEILAMPRDMIVYRSHYEQTGETACWKALYGRLTEDDKRELLVFTSHTIPQMKSLGFPDKFKELAPYYFLKYQQKSISPNYLNE